MKGSGIKKAMAVLLSVGCVMALTEVNGSAQAVLHWDSVESKTKTEAVEESSRELRQDKATPIIITAADIDAEKKRKPHSGMKLDIVQNAQGQTSLEKPELTADENRIARSAVDAIEEQSRQQAEKLKTVEKAEKVEKELPQELSEIQDIPRKAVDISEQVPIASTPSENTMENVVELPPVQPLTKTVTQTTAKQPVLTEVVELPPIQSVSKAVEASSKVVELPPIKSVK